MKRVISGQLRLGDAELTSHKDASILAKIDAAQEMAGLNRLLFLPSHNPKTNDAVLNHCRRRGLEVFLWYKVLADNDIIAEKGELNENAWGRRDPGESGVWMPMFASEETYIFGCPRNRKYNDLLLGRCRAAVADYDGLFVDCVGFPLPSLGLESVFSCFCPECRAAEPRLGEWRDRVLDMRESLRSATDADLERWGTFQGIMDGFGLMDFFRFRSDSITMRTGSYADLAKSAGKQFGVDVISPLLTLVSGHDYRAIGAMADWIKPRIYYRIFGPSAFALELSCLILGLKAWGPRFGMPELLRLIGRSTGLDMPASIHSLDQNYMDDSAALHEIANARRAAAPCPVHPGLDFSLHPDYDTGITNDMVDKFLDATSDCPGLVLTWNLLFIPDSFLERIGGKAG